MKKISLFLAFALILGLFAGCAGTPVVYYTDCTCPVGSHEPVVEATEAPEVTEAPVLAEGAVKTGLYIGVNLGGSQSAGEEDGKAVINADECVDCGTCASVCPVEAPQAE